jgi:hypothetical protein
MKFKVIDTHKWYLGPFSKVIIEVIAPKLEGLFS